MNIEDLTEQIINCKKCMLWKDAEKAVPGDGPDDAKVILVGQNPGKEEDRTGRPFVGRSGKFLDSVLKHNGIQRERLFITNVVKHKTHNNRRPTEGEIEACMPYLLGQIEIIEPEIVVLMGKVAWRTPRKEGIRYIQTYHPSAAMRFTKMKQKFQKDFRHLREIMK